MNPTHLRHLFSIFLLPLLVFTFGCESGTESVVGPDPVEETIPGENMPGAFTITSRQVPVSATQTLGTFEALGVIEDRGTVLDEMDSPEPLSGRGSVHGIKTLSSVRGSIKIEFYVGLSPVDSNTLRASGGFRIMEGTGAYEKLEGGGPINVEVASTASLDEIGRVLTGQARWAE